MGYTVEIKTERYGIRHVTDIVLGTPEEAARYIHELSERWPGLIREWQTIKTLKPANHTWGRVGGLEDKEKPWSNSDSDK